MHFCATLSQMLRHFAGRQVPIFSYFFLFFSAYSYFSYFFSNFLLFFLFFSHFTYNKQIFVGDLNILSLFKYVVYRVHFFFFHKIVFIIPEMFVLIVNKV